MEKQHWDLQQLGLGRFSREAPGNWEHSETEPGKENILERIRIIEERYEAENRLMELVHRGQEQKAQQMLSRFSPEELVRRGEPTRDVRNYTIILNTLMRKTVELAGVHPLYIDRLSSEFALRIEQTADWEAFSQLWGEMAQQYCRLVRKYVTREYSPLVQKVVAMVDMDLTADLSLRATAAALNVNPSYLSARFKRELGETLTEHVSRKRMEFAAYLLANSKLHISAVAQSCGIADDNYFTRLFRRTYGRTPRQFRQERQSGNV